MAKSSDCAGRREIFVVYENLQQWRVQLHGALKKMVDGAVKASDDHGIAALYKSKFVQDNVPTVKRYYPWSGEGDCLTWDDEKWAQFEFDEKLPGYVKCETLPTYVNIKKKTKK